MFIATWNTQGNCFYDGKLASLVSHKSLDVICVQECGNLFCLGGMGSHNVKMLYNSECNLGRRDLDYYNVVYYPWRNASRCSMATFIRRDHKILGSRLKIYEGPIDRVSGWSGIRDMVQTDIKYDNRIISINNVHLPSGNPNFAMDVARVFYSKCQGYRDNYIMIGDMNIPISNWDGECDMMPSIPKGTGMTQQSGNILDYMFTDMHVIESEVKDVHGSDHLCVVYEVE